MARLICAGLSVADMLFKPVDRDLFDKDSVRPDEVVTMTGGDALNATINLTKLGLGDEVKLVSLVGEDMFGDFILGYLKKQGVDTSAIRVVDDCLSAVCAVMIESCGERHFVYYGEASHRISADDVMPHLQGDTEFLHIGSLMVHKGLEREHHKRLFEYAQGKGIKTSFDVTNDQEGIWLPKIEQGLPFTDYFFASRDEAVAISGGLTEPEKLAAFFRDLGVKNFILKLGGKGCYATDYASEYYVPTYVDEPVVDTTGAGDAFVSGYYYGLLKGLSMQECCVLGNVNGTLGVSAMGATGGTGTLDQVKAFLKQHGALTIEDTDTLIAKL